jgi:hypothetical protein
LLKPLPHKVAFYHALIFSILFLLSFQLFASAVFSPADVQAQSQPVNPYGVNTFLEKEVELWKKERTFQMIKEGGIGWIKQHFPWEEIEFKKGYFFDDKFNKSSWQKFDEIVELARKNNINIVARLDRTPKWANPVNGDPMKIPANLKDYADFVKAFVDHYKGKINYIQVWNEPNLGYEWTGTVDSKKYVEMLKLAYDAAKSANPDIKVMTAPLAMNIEKGPTNLNEIDFLTQMYTAGAKPYFDLISANGYGLEFAPEDAPSASKLNFRRVELLRDVAVKNGDANKQIWFNEFGWNASPENFPKDKLIWRRVTEQQQADYTVRGFKYARENYPWAGVIFVWYFRQVGDIMPDRSDYYFQMVTTEFTPKPVYDALKKDALAYLAQKGQPTPVAVSPIVPPTTRTGGAATTAAANTTAAQATTAASTAAATTTSTVSASTTGAVITTATTAAVASTTAPTGSGSSSNDNSGAMIFIIIGAVIVLAAGGGVAYYFMQSRNRS